MLVNTERRQFYDWRTAALSTHSPTTASSLLVWLQSSGSLRQNSPQFKSNKKKTNGGFVMSDFGRTNTFLSVIRSIFAAHLSLSICPSKTGFVLVLHCLPTLFLQLLFSPSLLVWRACTQTSLTICCHKVVCVFIYVHVCMCVCFLQEQCKVRGKEYFSFLLAE